MTKRNVVVKQPDPPAEQVPVQILASAIVEIATAFKKVEAGPISQRALVLLIQDACGSRVNKEQIKLVLDTLPQLAQIYVRRPKQ